MNPEVETFLKHILESIEYVEAYTEGVPEQDFLQDVKLQDAVIRRLEIVGEATKNISKEFRATHPELPWKQMAGLRDILAHQYFGVDLELTYEIVKKDLPDLKQKVKTMLSSV